MRNCREGEKRLGELHDCDWFWGEEKKKIRKCLDSCRKQISIECQSQVVVVDDVVGMWLYNMEIDGNAQVLVGLKVMSGCVSSDWDKKLLEQGEPMVIQAGAARRCRHFCRPSV